ncbi:Aste57867_1421 [Aphanomyces stellatus]|uniref:Aste57867_1421 protein n=1 Tax=Aphanomyces stellatus TaxID=120398 RepID=A0A485K5L2_9STRA|nr:hypothetical protein As57867_001420 [Aphanomyces stellatus]VFT78638.1 Aste57867_1421 [Aphanomyces stellatus]
MMLQRRLLGQVDPLSRNGPAPVLTPGEEMGIVEAVNERTMHAQCFTHDELTNFIRVCIENSQHERIVPDTFPSLTFRPSHGRRSTVDVVDAHFTNLANVLADTHFDPDCIWNLDESGTCAQGSRNKAKVLASKRMPANAQKADSRQNVSVLVCVDAGANDRRRLPGSNFAATKSSFLSTTLFIQYFEWFVNHIGPKRPVLVLMDGYKAHWSARTIEYARSKNIYLYALPSHTSHFLQPLDVAVFAQFKRLLDIELAHFRIVRSRFAATSDMVAVASSALAKCLTRTYIVSGFEKAGSCPLSRDVMMSKIVGDKPGVKMKTVVQATVRVETQVVVHLREMGIHIDSARVLCINDAVVQAFTNRASPPKGDDDWIHVADKEAKKKAKEEMLVRKKKASALKRQITAKTKSA